MDIAFTIRRRLSITILLALALGFNSGVSGAQPETLKVCYTEWGKFGGEALPDQGFIPDMLRTVLHHAGYEMELTFLPWPRCVEQGKTMQFDIVGSAWRGPNFSPDFDYMTVVSVDSISFIVLDDSPLVSGEIEGLAGKKVGYFRYSGGLEEFYKIENQFETSAVTSEEAMLKILERGRVDMIVSDLVQLNAVAEKIEPPLTTKLRALQPPLQQNIGSPMISKSHPRKDEIIAAFNKSFHELVEDGLYQRLNEKHDMILTPGPVE